MKRRSLVLLAGSCAAAALLVAGCGSSGSGGSAAGSAPGQQATAGSIPVGVVGTFSGPEGTTTGSSKLAMQAWADAVNAAGGIDGHQVQLYLEDDAGNPSTSLVEVKTLVQQDHVVAIGHGGQRQAGPLRPQGRDTRRPLGPAHLHAGEADPR